MKKLLKSTALVLVLVFFIFLFFSNFFGSISSDSFPNLDEGAYTGSFSEPKGIEDVITSKEFLLEKIPDSEMVVFSLLESGARPLRIQLTNQRIIQKDENKKVVYDPLFVFPKKNCRLSGETGDETFKGVLRCSEGIEVRFLARKSGENVFSRTIDDIDPLDDPFRNQLQKQIFNIAQLEIANSHVQKLRLDLLAASERKEKLTELDSSTDSLSRLLVERSEQISTLKENRDILLEQIASLHDERGQLFRVSEKGVKVEHARRLMNLESDFYNRNWIQGGIQEDSIYLPEVGSPYNLDGSQYDRQAEEPWDNENDSRSSGEVKEWWKEIQ